MYMMMLGYSRVIKLAVVAVCLIVIITTWRAYVLDRQATCYSLVAMARAMGAYVIERRGALPDSFATLEEAGIVRSSNGKYYTLVDNSILTMEIPHPTNGMIIPSLMEVGWNGASLSHDGILLRPRGDPEWARDLCIQLTNELRSLINVNKSH